ncbi:MAG: hypothetical protein ACFFD2_01840 [Promethearchaeota archaeon]
MFVIILLALNTGNIFALFDYIDHPTINDNFSIPLIVGVLISLIAYGFGIL